MLRCGWCCCLQGSWSPSGDPSGGALFYAYPYRSGSIGTAARLEYDVFFPADFPWVKVGILNLCSCFLGFQHAATMRCGLLLRVSAPLEGMRAVLGQYEGQRERWHWPAEPRLQVWLASEACLPGRWLLPGRGGRPMHEF